MSSDDRRRDGSKLSYSERDKLRRERKDRPAASSSTAAPRSPQGDKSYRAQLERAFATGRVQEMADALSKHNTVSLTLPTTTLRPPAAAATDGDAAAPPPAPRKPVVDPVVAERRELADKIRDAEQARDAAKAIDKYLARFQTLPRDWDILEKALGHAKAAVVAAALGEIEAWLGREKPRRTRSLAMQLAILIDTHDDTEIREHAARLRAAL